MKKEHESLLDELFKIILTHIKKKKNALEYVYQKLSSYYTNTKQEILNESILLRYLKILKLFYSDVSSEAKTEKEIKNYEVEHGINQPVQANNEPEKNTETDEEKKDETGKTIPDSDTPADDEGGNNPPSDGAGKETTETKEESEE